MTIRTRFAPSPTGFMHIGNLRTCLYAYFYARQNDGKFILRIEDTDQERFVEGAVDIIYNTLRKAGVIHDEGPDKDGGYGPYVQSERKSTYMAYAKELVEKGGAYYCFCDKDRLSTLADTNGVKKYDKHCLHLSPAEVAQRLAAGEDFVIRQNVPAGDVSSYDDMVFGHIAVPLSDIEDGVLIKSDGMPTYNFANVIDDHMMAINVVIRGMEYLSSTPKYNLIYDSFGWERPQYMHLPPIMKDAQRKLSKRYGDANFEDFLSKGYLVPAIVNYIALLGWSPHDNREKMSLDELIAAFDVAGVSKSGSIFDEAKMRWLNAEYIKEMSIAEFISHAKPYLDASKIAGLVDYTKLSALLIPRVEILGEIASKVDFLAEFEGYDLDLFVNKKNKLDQASSLDCLKICLPQLENLTAWDNDSLQEAITALTESSGIKKATLYYALRIAISGAAVTPGGATEIADLLGQVESIRRITVSISRLASYLSENSL